MAVFSTLVRNSTLIQIQGARAIFKPILRSAEAFYDFTIRRRANQPLTLAELAQLRTLTSLMRAFGDLLPFIGTQVFTALDGLMRVVKEEGPTHVLNRQNTHVAGQRNGRASVDY